MHSLRDRFTVAATCFLVPTLVALAVIAYFAWRMSMPSSWAPLRAILVTAVILGAAGGVGVCLIMRRTLSGLHRSLEAANAMAAGRIDIMPDPDGETEIVELGRALRDMAAKTEASYFEIEEQNRSLERAVSARTEELRQKNLALAFQNEKVIEANRLKSAFLASVSHELRTPLNAILALSEMLRDCVSGPLSEEQSRQAAMIYTSGENLLHLINEVLDLSKIESGRMEITTERVDIVSHLVSAADAVRPLAEEKGLDFAVETEGGGVEAILDAEKLRQVFVNLVGNAIKFTSKGGVMARIRLLEQEDLLYVEIEDTGPGVAPKDQHQIFQEFRQVKEGTLPDGVIGTGLGLAISKKLVNLMGGDIWVDSAFGSGSRFAFLIPLRNRTHEDVPVDFGDDAHRGHADGDRSDTSRRMIGGHHLVLVADEDSIEAGVLGRYLRRQGCEVLTVTDGTEAIRVLRREPVDLLILDLMSPGKEGLRLIEQVEADLRLDNLPVIVNTAWRLSAEELEYLKPKVRSVFAKGTRGVRDLMGLVTQELQQVDKDRAADHSDGKQNSRINRVA